MADIVTPRYALARRPMARWILPSGRGESVGLWPGTTAGSNSEPGTIDAMKAKTGLQHLTVINQSPSNICKKTCRIYMSISLPSVRLCGGSPGTLDGAGRDFPLSVSVGGALNSRGMNGAGQPWR